MATLQQHDRMCQAMKCITFASAVFATVSVARTALAAEVEFQANDARSVMHIEKSENRNQVHYGLHLSPGCAPASDTPVYVYWRQRERGPDVVLPLLSIERPAYGISAQRVLARTAMAGRVSLRLRALPHRELTIDSWRDQSGVCRTRVTLRIANQAAILDSVFAQIGFLRVDYVLIAGTTPAGTHVKERIDP